MLRRQLGWVGGQLRVLGGGFVQLAGLFFGRQAWEDWGRQRRQRAARVQAATARGPVRVAEAAAPPPPARGKRGRPKTPGVRKAVR